MRMSVKNDSSDIAGQLRYIHCVRESCVGGLLTKMRFSLRLLDFHGLEEQAGAEYVPDIRQVLGFSSFGAALHGNENHIKARHEKKTGRKAWALLPLSQLAACPPPAPELPAYQAVAQPSSFSPFQAIASAGVPASYSIPGGRPVCVLNQVTKMLGKAHECGYQSHKQFTNSSIEAGVGIRDDWLAKYGGDDLLYSSVKLHMIGKM